MLCYICYVLTHITVAGVSAGKGGKAGEERAKPQAELVRGSTMYYTNVTLGISYYEQHFTVFKEFSFFLYYRSLNSFIVICTGMFYV